MPVFEDQKFTKWSVVPADVLMIQHKCKSRHMTLESALSAASGDGETAASGSYVGYYICVIVSDHQQTSRTTVLILL